MLTCFWLILFYLQVAESILVKCPGSCTGLAFVLLCMCACARSEKCSPVLFPAFLEQFTTVSVLNQTAKISVLEYLLIKHLQKKMYFCLFVCQQQEM